MAPIDNLPIELLREIGSFWEPDPNNQQNLVPFLRRSDIAALARTNRVLHAIFDSQLYDDKQNIDAVIWAAKHGKLAPLQKAIRYGIPIESEMSLTQMPNGLFSGGGWSALQLAMQAGHSQVTRELLINGARLVLGTLVDPMVMLEVRDPGSLITRQFPQRIATVHAIEYAAFCGLWKVVLYLAKEMNVDVNNGASFGRNCLHYAVLRPSNFKVIRLLLHLGADINQEETTSDRNTPLVTAIKVGNFCNAHYLLHCGARTDLPLFRKRPVHYCTLTDFYFPSTHHPHDENAKHALLRRLISLDGPAALNYGDAVENMSPLSEAVSYGTTRAVHILISAGADVNGGPNDQWPPLWRAVNSSAVHLKDSMIQILLENDVRLDQNLKIKQKTLIAEILTERPFGFIPVLSKATEVNITIKSLDKLLTTAVAKRNGAFCDVLLNKGAQFQGSVRNVVSWLKHDICQQADDNTYTLATTFRLVTACGVSQESIERLIEVALRHGRAAYVSALLIECYRPPPSKTHDPADWMQLAAQCNNLDVLRQILRRKRHRLEDLQIPLWWAARNNEKHVVRLLIGFGATPHARIATCLDKLNTCPKPHCPCSVSPLQISILRGNLNVVKVMAEKYTITGVPGDTYIPYELENGTEIARVLGIHMRTQ
ncbi:ankyrin repeat-containing domain protein [Xylariaceae sp. FL0255]|nr:ankyrin repeat-containing domain protein [Xylariaceae sp. FL0255]